jgi:hypothetical protein
MGIPGEVCRRIKYVCFLPHLTQSSGPLCLRKVSEAGIGSAKTKVESQDGLVGD